MTDDGPQNQPEADVPDGVESEPTSSGDDIGNIPDSQPTDGTTTPATRWVRVTFTEGGLQIEWAGVGPVDLLGAAGYMEWQAKYLLNSEMAQRAQRPVIVPMDHLAPGGSRRT